MPNDKGQPPQASVIAYIPGHAKRQPLHKAIRRWFCQTWWYTKYTVTPIESVLPPPVRKVPCPRTDSVPEDIDRRLAAAHSLVESAERRLDTIRTKANTLAGLVTLVLPILSWWLFTGRDRILGAPPPLVWTVNALAVVAIACLILSLIALFRSQRVTSYETNTPSLFVNLEDGFLKRHDWAMDLIRHAEIWACSHRWTDSITNFFRAGQRFLELSLIAATLASAIAYYYPVSSTTVDLQLSLNDKNELFAKGTFPQPTTWTLNWPANYTVVWYLAGIMLIVGIATIVVAIRGRRLRTELALLKKELHSRNEHSEQAGHPSPESPTGATNSEGGNANSPRK